MINFKGKLEDLNKNGIYEIRNVINGKVYIGGCASKNGFLGRNKNHYWGLVNKKHENSYLQNAFNKYGGNNFEFVIKEILSPEEVFIKEQNYLDEIFKMDSDLRKEKFYNLSDKAVCPPTWDSHSDEKKKEIKNKLRIVSLGRWDSFSNEKKIKISKKISEAQSGEKHHQYGKQRSIEAKKKFIDTWNSFSDEKKKEISKKKSNANKGKNNPLYISPIQATNIITGEVIIGHSAMEISQKIGVSLSAVCVRLNNQCRDYTMTPIKNKWMIQRIKEE